MRGAELEGQYPRSDQNQASHLQPGQAFLEKYRADQRHQADTDGRPHAVRDPNGHATLEDLRQEKEGGGIAR